MPTSRISAIKFDGISEGNTRGSLTVYSGSNVLAAYTPTQAVEPNKWDAGQGYGGSLTTANGSIYGFTCSTDSAGYKVKPNIHMVKLKR